MARIEDIERRLLNWARWKLGDSTGGLSYASVDLTLSNAGRDGYIEATVPTLDVEAEVTQQAVMSLDSHLRVTVEAVYVGRGTMIEKARELCCGEATIYARIDLAHYRISAWLSARAATAREQRRIVEALQEGARPKLSFTH